MLDGKQLSERNCCHYPDHDKAGRERYCEPIKVQSIPVLSLFRSWPKWSVSVPVISVLSCICSRRATPYRGFHSTVSITDARSLRGSSCWRCPRDLVFCDTCSALHFVLE